MLKKRIRVSFWLISSLASRYKRQIIVSFLISGFIVFFLWKLQPFITRTFLPSRLIIGRIGSYEATNLPLDIQNKISSGFTSIEEDGTTIPLLASSWESNKEATRYFFYFNDDVYWHDGEQFTAHDVNYNFRDVSISSADSNTLKIELNEPFAPLPTLLARPLFKEGLIGLGQYKVVKLTLKGNTVEHLVLKKVKEDNLNSASILDYWFYPNIDSAKLAFQLGEIDVLENIQNPNIFTGEPNVTITEKKSYDRFLALFFNNSKDPFTQKEFRQALSYTVPKVNDQTAYSPISPNSWAYNEKVRKYDYDKEQAKTLLEKSGVENKTITLSTFAEYVDIAQSIAKEWNDLGITTDVRVIQSITPDYDVLLGVQEIPSDPDQYQLWHSTQQDTNIAKYNNAKIDKLLEEGRKTTVQEERREYYLDFQKFLLEDSPVRFLFYPSLYTLSRK